MDLQEPLYNSPMLRCGTGVVTVRASALIFLTSFSFAGVQPGVPATMAGISDSLKKNPELAQRLGHNARKRVENMFSSQQCLNELTGYYKALCSQI